MLKFHRTSLMVSRSQTLVNTVNTVGVMGKGLAADFKAQCPEMFDEYRRLCSHEKIHPGKSFLWKGKGKWVLNFATKKHWRQPSKIEYLEDGLREFREKYEDWGIREVAFPRLGCGNGGLSWDDVKPVMLEYLVDLPIAVYIHDFEKNIGTPEHSVGEDATLFEEREPENFENFKEDIKRLVESNEGRFDSSLLSGRFEVELNKDFELYSKNGHENLLASEEELFTVWAHLSGGPLSRSDLPETAYDNAFIIFSLLEKLSYIRLINMAGRNGSPRVALEMNGVPSSESLSPTIANAT